MFALYVFLKKRFHQSHPFVFGQQNCTMKKTRLLISLSGIALIALGLALFNGCGKKGGGSTAPPVDLKSSAKTSAEPTSFNDVAAHLDAGGNLYLYLSTEQWLDGLSGKVSGWRQFFSSLPDVRAEDLANINKAFDVVTRVIKDSGVEDVSGFGMSSLATDKGSYRSKTMLHHYKGKGSGFIWTMFGREAHALGGLDMLPANTAAAMFSDLDLAQLWSVIRDEVKQSGFPEAQAGLDQLPAQFQKGTGLNWDKTLASFGGEYGLIMTLDESKMVPIPLPTSQGLEIPEPGLLIVAKVNDDTVFNRLEQLLVQSRQQVIRVDESGLKMRTLQVPVPMPIQFRPTVAMADGYLFLASNDALVREALAVKSGKKSGLKSTDEFKRLAQEVPLQGNQFTFISQRFGQTIMKVQQQMLEMQSQMSGGRSPNWSQLLGSFWKPENAGYSFCVGANTDEGWLTVGNGNQNPAVVLAVVPAAAIGMLAAIAIPNFVKARSTAQGNSCINNLRQIDGAKEQWALEKNKKTGDAVTEADVAQYIRNGFPVCPQGGHYTIGSVGENPQCSIPGHSLQ